MINALVPCGTVYLYEVLPGYGFSLHVGSGAAVVVVTSFSVVIGILVVAFIVVGLVSVVGIIVVGLVSVVEITVVGLVSVAEEMPGDVVGVYSSVAVNG